MKMYVVAHHYAYFDKNADECAYLIGVFNTRVAAENAKLEYLNEFANDEDENENPITYLMGGARSVSITEVEMNAYSKDRPFDIADTAEEDWG